MYKDFYPEPEKRIERYTGPYERWVFTDELGGPFAFPAISEGQSSYYTALMEGPVRPPEGLSTKIRLPPLWNPLNKQRNITPFAFHAADMNDPRRKRRQDTEISELLKTVREHIRRSRRDFNPRFRVNFPIAPESWVPTYHEASHPDTWRAPATQPKAIVAVIDDGLPFAHRAFLDSTGQTRISHCWLQSGTAQSEAHIPFGREYVNAEIDALRSQFPQNEQQLYRAAGAIEPQMKELGTHLRRHMTHGSHVLGIAAGNSSLFPDHPMDDDIQIIAVQLPNTIAWDTSGFGKEMYMLSALHYVFERARQIAEFYGADELPLVVNFSYGWSAGRHDGQSEMEIAIEELLEDRQSLQAKTAIVMPMGNNFASKMHARFPENSFSGETIRLGWQIQPADKTSSYLEMWFPEGFDPAGYHLTIEPPTGQTLDIEAKLDISAEEALQTNDDGDPRRFIELEKNGQVIGQLSADQHRGNRWRVMIALIPTLYVTGQNRKAPSGKWTVTLSRDETAASIPPEHDVLVWLQRDDDPSNLKTHGRQSYLRDAETDGYSQEENSQPLYPTQIYSQEISAISGYGAMNAVASSSLTTRVGGYVQQTGRPCGYSGAGGLHTQPDGTLVKWGEHVDVVAVADQSHTRPGIPSIGVLSGARARLIGTSGAAPTVARLMVRNIAAGKDLFDGFSSGLDIYRTEEDIANTVLQHKSRLGENTVLAVAKSG